jgi:hypothetical protein
MRIIIILPEAGDFENENHYQFQGKNENENHYQ